MGREEQIEEREVLESIFPDEITNVSDIEFRLSIILDVTNEDGDDSEAPSMILRVKYPDGYPDEAPILDISAAANAPPHSFFDVASDKDHLLGSLTATIEENLGMAMVFTLVSTLKDSAEKLISERQSTVREKHEQRILAAEAEENKKFHGTPVTPETFSKWRVEFRREMEELRIKEEAEEEAAEKKKNRGKESIERLTGKQLWERDLVGKAADEYDEGDGDDLPTAGVEKLKIST